MKKIVEFTELNLSQLNADDFNLYLQTLDGLTDYRVKKSVLNDALGGGLLTATVSLTADQIQTGNSIPIDTGILYQAGKAIEVISANIAETSGGEAFESNQILLKNTSGGFQMTHIEANPSGFLCDATRKNSSMGQQSGLNIIENEPLLIETNVDSIGVGDGTIKINILYRIITI